MFDNSYFDNIFDFVWQFKNVSFKVHVLVHKKSKLKLIKHNQGPNYVWLIPIWSFDFFRLG